jgi:hypothetical protein
MKHKLKSLLTICCFTFTGLSAGHLIESSTIQYESKVYFDSSDLEITDDVIYIHVDDILIEANTIRIDQQGLHIFGNDIINCRMGKDWKCPYCNRWWPIGQKCQNRECPTNQW